MYFKEKNSYLEADFKCKDFSQALIFVNKIGEVSERLNHHPDILLYGYNKVNIKLITHSESLITEKDYIQAEEINNIYKELTH